MEWYRRKDQPINQVEPYQVPCSVVYVLDCDLLHRVWCDSSFYGGFTPLIFVFFFGFGLSAFGLVGSCVYMGLRTQSQFDKVVAELSSEYASKGITFRQERTQVSASYGRRSTMRTISWLVVSFRNSTRSMGAEPEIQAYPKQVESFESPSTPSAPPAYV